MTKEKNTQALTGENEIKENGTKDIKKKSTTKLLRELKMSRDFKKFYTENEDNLLKDELCDLLGEYIKKYKLKKSEVIRRAEMSEIYGYQIFSGARKPERNKLICLIIGMGLNIEEAQLVLRSAGYTPLYVKIPQDSVILYGICNKLSIIELNEMLYKYGCEMLG